MPVTVPKNPSSGATLAVVASTARPRSRRPISNRAAFSIVFSTSSLGWPYFIRPALRIEATGPRYSSQTFTASRIDRFTTSAFRTLGRNS